MAHGRSGAPISTWCSVCYIISDGKGIRLLYSLLQILSQLQLALEWNKDIAEFLEWNESHESKCESNFDGSSSSMEPVGLVKIFKHSLDYKLLYKHFASDGDNSTLASLMKK